MNKKFARFFALFLIIIIGAYAFSACALFQFEEYIPDDPFREEPPEPDYDFVVACSDTETTIEIANVGERGDVAKLVYLKPHEYLTGEFVSYMVDCVDAEPTFVASYECGTEATFKIDRYVYASGDEEVNAVSEDGGKYDYDTVYCKFYVINDKNDILAGPVYASDIKPIYDHDEVVKVNGIKGVATGGGTSKEVLDLGCEHVQLGMMTTSLIVPLETYNEETGEVTPIEYEEHLDENGKGYIVGPYNEPQYVEAMWHNGKKFYFRTGDWRGYGNFDAWDREISLYTRAGVKVTILLLMGMQHDQYIQPYFITYEEARYKPAGYYAVDTSNPYGAEYWSAFTEFIARRYSCEDSAEEAQHGTVEAYVLSNEIDQQMQWNCTFDIDKYTRLSTDEYVLEFERMMRIANQSFKKVYSRNITLIPITHWWNGNGGGSDYNPKDIFDGICTKTRREGNYNWGLAIHPYGMVLAVTAFWRTDARSNDTINGDFNTRQITWTNLEVLQLYLEQDLKRCNGQIREVYVTEGGVSSGGTADGIMSTKDKAEQAAGIAYAYYKSTQLSCITALNYYKLIDTPEENAYFGLMSPYPNPLPKPSYYLYKELDTDNTWNAAAQYLENITWTIFEGNTMVSHGYGIDVGFTWFEAMRIVKSDFDWNSHWDESKIITKKLDALKFQN